MSNRRKQSRAADRAGGRTGSGGSGAGGRPGRSGGGGILGSATQLDRRTQIGVIVVMMILGGLVVMATDFVFGAFGGSGSSPSATSAGASSAAATSTAGPAATPTQLGVVKQGVGGHWTNVGAGQLAEMLTHKDFTLVNVKTPYIGEIDGTDLYITYDQLKASASQLPADKGAKILVYCRSGAESAVAAQTLLDLRYTNVWNLDGGMNAWTASGRQLVQKNR
jgi:rhodanese-related sulfurtransferase